MQLNVSGLLSRDDIDIDEACPVGGERRRDLSRGDAEVPPPPLAHLPSIGHSDNAVACARERGVLVHVDRPQPVAGLPGAELRARRARWPSPSPARRSRRCYPRRQQSRVRRGRTTSRSMMRLLLSERAMC